MSTGNVKKYRFCTRNIDSGSLARATKSWNNVARMPNVAAPVISDQVVNLRSKIFAGSLPAVEEFEPYFVDKENGAVASCGVNVDVYYQMLDKLAVITNSPFVAEPNLSGFRISEIDRMAEEYLNSVTRRSDSEFFDWIHNNDVREVPTSIVLARAVDFFTQALRQVAIGYNGEDDAATLGTDTLSCTVKSIYNVADKAARLYVDRNSKAITAPEGASPDELIDWALNVSEENMLLLLRTRAAFFVDLGCYVLATVNDRTRKFSIDCTMSCTRNLFGALRKYWEQHKVFVEARCVMEGTKSEKYLSEISPVKVTMNDYTHHRAKNKL